MAWKVGLVTALDTRLPILKRCRPYSEADHVLNIAYNILCGGAVLDDIEVRRSDGAFLDALGTRTIPDPTTAGDFCRRFDADGTASGCYDRLKEAALDQAFLLTQLGVKPNLAKDSQ